MNTKTKYIAGKVLIFVLLRVVEITAMGFLMMFLIKHFSGWMMYTLMGGTSALYLFYVIGLYVDMYREKHRLDDVKL